MNNCSHWIEQAGNTLEAYVTVPKLMEELDMNFYKAIQWLRRNYRYVEFADSPNVTSDATRR